MIVEYNGINLEMAEIQSIHREAVWDDSHTHLLYIRWTIGVIAQYAPNGYPAAVSVTRLRTPTISASLAGSSGIGKLLRGAGGALARGVLVGGLFNVWTRFKGLFKGEDADPTIVALRTDPPSAQVAAAPDADSGVTGYGPILTDVTLRNRLMTPRKKLRIKGWNWDGSAVNLIESPKENYVCDPTNGPHPIALDILDGNDMSFAVFFQIETATLPCDDNSDRLVLSHTWEMSHTHDENQYLTRVIDGEIVLNGSMVHSFGLPADALRAQFFHPIPLGCYRTVPFVTPSVDGLSYRYRIEDHDQTIVFDAGDSGATHIEIAEKVSYYQKWKPIGH